MKAPNITPGPWMPCGSGTLQHPVTGESLTTHVIEAQGWGRIGEWYDYSNEEQANARAIAALPDVLAVLAYIFGRLPAHDTKSISQARAALLKAGFSEGGAA